jgi:uncharacterized protein (DUF58 family)
VNSQSLVPAPATAEASYFGRLGVGFGRRFLGLLLLGLLWAVPGFWSRTFLWGMVAWDAIVVIAFIGDLVLMPRQRKLEVTRQFASVPAIGCRAEIKLRVVNRSDITIHCVVQDDPPPALRADKQQLPCVISPQRAIDLLYTVDAIERGDYTFGDVYIRVQSAMQLAERWYRAKLPQKARIYPNLEGAQKATIYLMRSRQIDQERRRLRLRGHGHEFESLRDYQEGDELRNICWSASARRGKLVSKVYTIERSQPVWIVLDAGRLLRARVGAMSKLDYAADAALCLAQLALYSGDKVGLLAYGRRIKSKVPPARGMAHLRVIADQLATITGEAPEGDHLLASGTLGTVQRRRSLVIWVTDLAETAMTPEVIEGASQLLKHHVVLFVVVGQPELEARTGEVPQTPERMYEMAAAQEMIQRRELLLSRMRDQGALAMEVMPGKLSTTLMDQYLSVKERRLI